MSAQLLIDREGDIGYITFNRPDVRNAISTEMWRDIPGHMDKLRNEGAGVIVFRGTAGTFASGADLEEMRKIEGQQDAAAIWHSILGCLEHIWQFELPTIAMIHGSCIGGGCLLATACDFRVATHSSSFEVPVARLGLVLDDRTIARLVAAGGVAFAREILVAAATIGAERGYVLGYLIDVVEDEGLEAAAKQLASRLLRNVQYAVSASKKAINAAAMQPTAIATISDELVVSSYLNDEFRKRLNG